MLALASGRRPACRHDGQPWRPEDADRRRQADTELGFKGAILYLQGYWSEYCSTYGFPNWASVQRPCFLCNVAKDCLFQVGDLSPVSCPARLNVDADYFSACDRCEVVVRITAEHHARLQRILRYDKRRGGSRGLALSQDYPPLGLLSGDRLEPSTTMPNISVCSTTGVISRSESCFGAPPNPLFDVRLGLGPVQAMTIDTLHTMHLGVYAHWCKRAAWFLLEAGIWGAPSDPTEERHQIGVLCMRTELSQFYEEYKRNNRDAPLTTLHDLTVKMLGTRNDPALHMSGAETWGFLLYLLWYLSRHRAALPPSWRSLHEAGGCLR